MVCVDWDACTCRLHGGREVVREIVGLWAVSRRGLAFSMLGLVSGTCLALSVTDAGAASVAKLQPIRNNDAFLFAPPRFYGVFDGVSACPESRAYAQTLAKTFGDTLVRRDAIGNFNIQARIALKAATKKANTFKGASTVCVVRVDTERAPPTAYCYNIGDSTAMVLRPSAEDPASLVVANATTAKTHDNGAPYQLAGRTFQSDKVEDGETFAFEVGAGDVVLCFTDGISCNLEPPEIAKIASAASTADEMAKALVERARDACIVSDDTTCVALRIGEGPAVGAEAGFSAEEMPWEKLGLRVF